MTEQPAAVDEGNSENTSLHRPIVMSCFNN